MSILYQCFGIIDSHGSFCFPKIIFQRNSDHLKTFKEIHSRFLGQKSHFLLKICNSVLSKLHYFFLVFQKLFFFLLNICLNLCSQANENTQVKLMDIEWELDGTPT